MAKKKYIKDSKGVTVSVTTDTLGLEKPLLNENYDIDVHNRNMDKIDEDLKPIDDSYIIELFQHDGDTTNPRDYYTKVEADEKFASKEDVENIDLSNLATKEEANNALNKANEAFLRGDNVKNQLVDKLISEGLNVSTNNTFEELISGIALGKKWASGTASYSSLKVKDNWEYLSVRGLDFRPSIIIVEPIIANTFPRSLSTYNASLTPCIKITFFSSETSVTSYWNDVYANNRVFDDGFDMPLAYYSRSNTSLKYSWMAFE